MTPGIAEIKAAGLQIQPYVRRTPLMAASPLKSDLERGWQLYYKLENLQITGSFKARGAVNRLLSLSGGTLNQGEGRGLITASGGNHGLGVAYAGWLSGRKTVIYLPESTPPDKASKIEAWGAQVIRYGQVWDDANAAALAQAERDNLIYFHPFADEAVIAGQATIGLEMLQDQPDLDTLVVAIGGGGLISGIALAAKALKPDIKIIGVEPTGAPTLYESMRAGRVVELAQIQTKVGTLAPRKSAEINFEIIRQHVSEIVLITDQDMVDAQRWLVYEAGIASELAGSAAMAAILTGGYQPGTGEKVGVVICAANTDFGI